MKMKIKHTRKTKQNKVKSRKKETWKEKGLYIYSYISDESDKA